MKAGVGHVVVWSLVAPGLAQTPIADAQRVLDAFHGTALPPTVGPAQREELARIAALLKENKADAARIAWGKFCRGFVTRATSPQVKTIENWVLNKAFFSPGTPLDAALKGWKQRLALARGNPYVANQDLVDQALQGQQQAVKSLSNVSKLLHDTSLDVIRKVGS